MPVTIRSAALDDVPALLALERGTASAAHWTEAQYERRVADGLILAAEGDGSIFGFICAREVASVWEIENVVVAAQNRRSGAADGLLRELLRRVRDHGGAAAWLEVRESNEPARRLYEKHGFRKTGRRRRYYRNPIEDAVLYEFHQGANHQKKADLKS
jgi:ribosomal-protein-alanine N-acetyltransferase